MLIDLNLSITILLSLKVMEQFLMIKSRTDNNLKTVNSKNSKFKTAKLYKEYRATIAVASTFKIDQIPINLKISYKSISKA